MFQFLRGIARFAVVALLCALPTQGNGQVVGSKDFQALSNIRSRSKVV